MEDEFDRIMAFFSLSPEEKESRLQEVFEDSVEYFERFKHIMVNGTPEEKKKAVEKVMILKKRIEEETKRICEKTGMTEEQLAQYSSNPKNFTGEQWNAIEGAKKKLESGVGEIRKIVRGEAPAPENKAQAPKKEGEEKGKKKRKKPKNWIPS